MAARCLTLGAEEQGSRCPAVQLFMTDELEEIKQSIEGKGSNELRILNEIGQGSYGRVYRAIWRGTIVAAKEVPTAGNEKVVANELSVYRSLNHPNLLTLLGTISNPFSLTLITNYVRGCTLHNLIFASEKKVNYRERVFIAVQLSQAILFMHTSNPPIAHLDIKPENVLVEEHTLRVVLGDFGLGK